MEKDLKCLDTETLKRLYSHKAKELEASKAKGTLQHIKEQHKLLTDLAIEIYQRFHRTLNFQAMEQPVRELKFHY